MWTVEINQEQLMVPYFLQVGLQHRNFALGILARLMPAQPTAALLQPHRSLAAPALGGFLMAAEILACAAGPAGQHAPAEAGRATGWRFAPSRRQDIGHHIGGNDRPSRRLGTTEHTKEEEPLATRLGTQLDSGELAGCHTRSPALSPVSTTTDTRPSGVHPGVRRSWTRPCRDSAPPPACP